MFVDLLKNEAAAVTGTEEYYPHGDILAVFLFLFLYIYFFVLFLYYFCIIFFVLFSFSFSFLYINNIPFYKKEIVRVLIEHRADVQGAVVDHPNVSYPKIRPIQLLTLSVIS